MRAAGLILAGGTSRRMGGGHKFLLELAGKPLMAHVIERLAPQVATIAISANCDPALLPADYPVLADAAPSRGPLSGVLAGLRWAAEQDGISHLATAAADTPFFPVDLVSRLTDAMGQSDVAIAVSHARSHPTFALWRSGLANQLDAWLTSAERPSVLAFSETLETVFVDFGASLEDPFFNVNTPEDLDAARRRGLGAGN